MQPGPGRSWSIICTFAAVLIVAGADGAAAQIRAIPLDIDIEGCVKPSDRCNPTYNEIRLSVDRRDVALVVTLFNVRRGLASSGGVLDDLRWRPLRAYGSRADLEVLRPGAKVRIHALLRTLERMLLIESAATISEGPAPKDTRS